MRVITGTAKGRKLFSFGGKTVGEGRRPTSDFIKQAIFSRIQFDIEGRRVLDLFAGTGQLGIETLSRGAVIADFVDTDTATVEKNIAATGFADRANVIKSDALTFLKRVSGRYDLIFLDPPYRSDLLDKVLREITAIDILNIGGIIVCESQRGALDCVEYSGYVKREYGYSEKTITLYTRVEVDE